MLDTIAIIQARMGSSRFPGKVMENIHHKPMLARVIDRVRQAKTIDKVIVATTKNEEDDIIADYCEYLEADYWRGSSEDVLWRFAEATLNYGGDIIVRITGDCPFIEPSLIDLCVATFMSYYPDIDYVSNLLPRTYPRGLDVEVIGRNTLLEEERTSSQWREHVTLNIRKNPDKYRIRNIANDIDYSYIRLTVDTEEDLEVAGIIYNQLREDLQFNWRTIIDFVLNRRPELLIGDKQVDPV